MKTNYKIFLFALLLTAVCSVSVAQTPELKKKLKQANQYYERQDYLKALTIYSEIFKEDIANFKSAYRAGLCAFNLNRLDSMTLLYFSLASNDIPEAHYYMGRINHFNNNLFDALNEFLFLKAKHSQGMEVSISEIEQWIRVCKRGIEQTLNKKDIFIRNLGATINTQYSDYASILSNDEQTLVFTSRREGSTGGEKDPYGNYFEDIYYCTKTDSGWSAATPIGNKINTNTHDAAVTFTPDSNALILYRTDSAQTGGDLYISRQTANEWQSPVLLNSKINSEYLEASACFSPDGTVIVFSSNRPGGYGGKDLYKIRKFDENKYSLPQNLGPQINTANDEDAPFINLDGTKLYFSSNGHTTIGGYDVFSVAFDPNTGKCGTVISVGAPVNSTADDIFFVLKKDNTTGYFSSNRISGYGESDIYEVNIEEPQQKIFVIKGSVVVNTNNINDLNKLQITLLEPSGKISGIYKLKKKYDTFILLIEKDVEYKVIIESPEIETIVKTMKFEKEEVEFYVTKKTTE